MTEINKENIAAETNSAIPSITRKQFIGKVLKGAAITGGAMLAPKVLDKFLVPPAYASSTSCNASDTSPSLGDRNTAAAGGDAFSFATNDSICSG